MKIILSLCLVTVSVLLVGCTVHRKLKVTEVTEERVEIFLDEDSAKELSLASMKLKWIAQDGTGAPVIGELALGVVPTPLRGQQFLVIYEDPAYMGPPVTEDPSSTRRGIKVSPGFFPDYGSTISVSMSVSGEQTRRVSGVFPTKDRVSDLVRFGPSPRPPLEGAFREDGTLNGIWPHGNLNQTVSRAFSGGTAQDTDSEGDWSLRDRSEWVPTPP